MKLSNLLAIAGGVVGLAAGGDTASQIASGAAIVSGVAGATGNSNLAKIAGITALGAGAYSAFGGDLLGTSKLADDGSSKAADAFTSAMPDPSATTTDASVTGGPSGNGNSFSDARSAAQSGIDYNGGLPGASDTPVTPATSGVLPSAAQTGAIAPIPTSGTAAGIKTAPSLFDSARSAAGDVGSFLDKNKELVKLAGGALDGAFGATAQQNSLLKQRLQMQQDQIDRANANSNNVTALNLGVTPNPVTAVRRLG